MRRLLLVDVKPFSLALLVMIVKRALLVLVPVAAVLGGFASFAVFTLVLLSQCLGLELVPVAANVREPVIWLVNGQSLIWKHLLYRLLCQRLFGGEIGVLKNLGSRRPFGRIIAKHSHEQPEGFRGNLILIFLCKHTLLLHRRPQ